MELALIIAAGLLVVPLFWIVHIGLDRISVLHARRWCVQRNLEIVKVRCRPAFDEKGVKTEFTWVDLACRDESGKMAMHRLRVWIFGVRDITSIPLDEISESRDQRRRERGEPGATDNPDDAQRI